MIPFLIILAVLAVLILLTSYICFRMAFYASRKPENLVDEFDIPDDSIYGGFRDLLVQWMKAAKKLPQEDISIRSFDGLELWGTYFECALGAPIEILFHGYRGHANREMSGAVRRCHSLGHSALIVDQRACGRSEGNVITFGINERKDCLTWLELMQKRFGPDQKIILTGISMGASTVMLAAGQKLPSNVIGILADCGYSSPKEIMLLAMEPMGIPKTLGWPFVKLGAKLFGRFDPEADSPVEALKKAKVPVIFFHGEDDGLVPCYMSKLCYDACASRKHLVTIPGADHGLSYAVAPELYLKELGDFFGPEASYTK